eukprot:TRINITY_DN2597_c1_g3_i3.p3 TRINITY_DN2597_c1_g3~~TRINITY_DN2597_c1_g3_i3.p3  ORF type:complete len:128 (-),score=23.65 TRINITY_DN2597_c1_g3_i3:29-412(-)
MRGLTQMPDRNDNQLQSEQSENRIVMRERQWIYLGPIAAAPVAHLFVTLYKGAKSERAKKWLMWGGVVGSTIATVGMRLFLMNHAGYPGGENSHVVTRQELVSVEEKEARENPSLGEIAKEAAKGFG